MQQSKRQSLLTVEGVKVVQQNLLTTLDLIGNTSAETSTPVLPPFPAKVLSVSVKLGDYVEEGAVLFTLDASDIEGQITQAEFGVKQAQNGLKLANIGIKNAEAGAASAELAYAMAKSNYEMNSEKYEFAKSNLEKYEQLFKEGVVSEAEYEQVKLQASPETITLLDAQLKQAEQALGQAQLGKEQAAANVAQAKIGVDQANEGLKKAAEAVDDLVVTAPVSGYVTTLNVSENVMAANTQVAVMIEELNIIKVSTSVTSDTLNLLTVGEKVSVVVNSFDSDFVGTIDSVALTADMRTLLYPVVIKVDNGRLDIKPGMFATIQVIKGKADNVLAVPTSAVLVRDGKDVVYVQVSEDRAEERVIEKGIDTGFLVEVKEGLTLEDVVITKGVGLIEDDTIISVVRGDE
jgi:RND family efflux transporter MFP subunit